jgi:hypothetical protein
MGLEPTTFCMASARDVRCRSHPFAQTACFCRFPFGGRTGANPSYRPTLPFLPRLVWDRDTVVAGYARELVRLDADEALLCLRSRPSRRCRGSSSRNTAAAGRGHLEHNAVANPDLAELRADRVCVPDAQPMYAAPRGTEASDPGCLHPPRSVETRLAARGELSEEVLDSRHLERPEARRL